MLRQPEEELMDDPAQARAYAEADFEAPHSMFMALFEARFGGEITGRALDLGCGPCDISRRFAQRYPEVLIDAVDGAAVMLQLADQMLQRHGLSGRVKLRQRLLPDVRGLAPAYDVIFSNSLLHHLGDPLVLWRSIVARGRPGTQVFVMDLLRPESLLDACRIVSECAADEPEQLQHDFYNSLLAAYGVDEIEAQLEQVGLTALIVEQVSEHHVVVSGALP